MRQDFRMMATKSWDSGQCVQQGTDIKRNEWDFNYIMTTIIVIATWIKCYSDRVNVT